MNERKKCPYCGEEIAVTAKKCRYCGEWLEPVQQPAQKPIQQPIQQPLQQQPMPQQPIPQQPIPQQPMPQQPIYTEAPNVETAKEERSFFQAYFLDSYISRYVDFSGYTSRKTFWLTYVAMTVLSLGVAGLCLLAAGLGGSAGMIAAVVIYSLVALAVMLPGLAITCRRLRDAGFSPWMILITLIPGLGGLILLVLECLPSKHENEEGYDGAVSGSFKALDGFVIGVCVVLLAVGSIMSAKSLGSALGGGSSSEYDLGDDESYATEYVEDVSDDDDSDDNSYSAASSEVGGLDLTPGEHTLSGYFYYKSQSFPVMVDYTCDNSGEITSAVYHNVSQKVDMNMDIEIYGNSLIMNSKDGTFNITLSYEEDSERPWKGTATQGDNSLRAEMAPVR